MGIVTYLISWSGLALVLKRFQRKVKLQIACLWQVTFSIQFSRLRTFTNNMRTRCEKLNCLCLLITARFFTLCLSMLDMRRKVMSAETISCALSSLLVWLMIFHRLYRFLKRWEIFLFQSKWFESEIIKSKTQMILRFF